MKPIPVLVAGVFTPAMADRLRVKAPFGPPVIDVVFVGLHAGFRRDEPWDERAKGRWLDVFQHPDHPRAAPLDPAQNRGLFLL